MTDGAQPRGKLADDRGIRTVCCVFGASLIIATTSGLVLNPVVERWATVCVAICVQASPYVLLGVVVSTAVRAMPARALAGLVPRRSTLAVPMMSMAGVAMPGCECGSVPAAATMIDAGVPAGPSVAFMLAAPGANPVVLAATAAAFRGEPRMVAARFVGALMLAIGTGLLTSVGVLGRPNHVADEHAHGTARPWSREGLLGTASEFAASMGLLSAGAAVTAGFVVVVPRAVLAAVADQPLVDVLALATLAVLLGICSQADAFVARSFLGFSRTAQLAFMLVGPAVDLKLMAMQAGAFGMRFALRLSALTFCLAVVIAAMVATCLQ